MLPELIIKQWTEESRIEERVQKISSESFVMIQKVFQHISNLPPDEVRSLLTEADKKDTRDLAWWLLGTALNLKTAKELEKAKSCVDWAEFVAQYTDSLSNREEYLEAHCEFVKGVLLQQKEDLKEAQLSYTKAEESYRHANASLVLQGLAIYSQGAAALEADDIEGNRMLYGGYQERFKKALEILRQSATERVRQQVQEVIERSLKQWQFMNELVKTKQSDDLLAENPTFVDQSLVRLLRARMRNLAVDEQPVMEVLRVAHLAENISNRMGKELNCSEELLYYYIYSKHLDAAELILQEQIKLNPEDLDLQKSLAGLLADQGKYLESRNLLEKVLEENPDESEVHGLLSFSLLELNDRVGADFHAHRAIEIDPKEYYADLVLQHLKATEPKAAVNFKDGSLVIGPDFSEIAPEEGAALIAAAILADKPEKIEASLKEITQSDPNLGRRVISIMQTNGILPSHKLPPDIEHYERAEQLFSQARWKEAVQEYKQAIAADHNLAKAYTGLGDVYYRIGQYYVALAHFEESLAIQPDPYAYRFLGDSYRMVDKRQYAVESYRQALKLDPNYAGARQALQDSLREEALPRKKSNPSSPSSFSADSSIESLGAIPVSPPGNETENLNLWTFKQIGDERKLGETDQLIEKMAASYPLLNKLLSAETLEEQISLFQPPITQEEYERLHFFLITIQYNYKEKDRRLSDALNLAKLEYHLAQMLPQEWSPQSAMGHSRDRHIADALQSLGAIHLELGNPSRALDYCLQAEEWYKRDALERKHLELPLESDFDRIFNQAVRSTLFESISRLYQDLGDGEKARVYKNRQLEIEQQSTTTESQINVLLRLGDGAFAADDCDGALRDFHKALDLALADSDSQITARNVVTICHYIGETLSRKLSLYRQALQYHEKALELNRQSGHLDRMSYDYRDIGKIYELRPDLGDALEAYEAALTCASKQIEEGTHYTWQASDGTLWRITEPESAWPSILAIGQIYMQKQDYEKADAVLALAIKLGEVIRSNVVQEEYRIAYQGSRQDAYDLMIKMHVQLALQNKSDRLADEHGEKAWEYVERSKSRTFLDSLGISSLRQPNEIPEEWRNQEVRLLESLESLSRLRLIQTTAQKRATWDEYAQIRSQLEKLWQEIAYISPIAQSYVNLRQGQPIQFQALQQLLTEGEVEQPKLRRVT